MPVTDEELRAELSRALGRPVTAVDRRPWPYASSRPMEELDLPGCGPLLLKHVGARARGPRPDFLVDPLREIEAYRMLPDAVDVPACHVAAGRGDGAWLVLELVDGAPLWQKDLAAWEATARWAARLHATTPPAGQRLLRYDGRFFRRWVLRALAMRPQLAPLRPAAETAIERLVRWPSGLVHGELYASNVLVQEPASRVRAIDWETVGLGPGLVDVAALVAGRWTAAERDAVVAAYRAGGAPAGPDFDGTLDAARLLVALQWLGWSPTWSPPAQHRHDWLAEARGLAARIAA